MSSLHLHLHFFSRIGQRMYLFVGCCKCTLTVLISSLRVMKLNLTWLLASIYTVMLCSAHSVKHIFKQQLKWRTVCGVKFAFMMNPALPSWGEATDRCHRTDGPYGSLMWAELQRGNTHWSRALSQTACFMRCKIMIQLPFQCHCLGNVIVLMLLVCLFSHEMDLRVSLNSTWINCSLTLIRKHQWMKGYELWCFLGVQRPSL